MSRQANPTVIGAFVVGALALVVAAVMSLASGVLTRERFATVAYFTGNVRGLQQGSAVEFRGVRVGTVTDISLVYDAERRVMRIPVRMDLDPERLIVIGSPSGVRTRAPERFLDDLVEQGLRAQLDLKSFVTGQLSVGLDMRPDTPVLRVGGTAGVYELPTVPSTLDRVARVLQDLPLTELVSKLISTLDATERLVASGDLERVVRDAAGAVADARRLVSTLESRVVPLADDAGATLDQVRGSMGGLEEGARQTIEAYAALARSLSAKVEAVGARLDAALVALATIPARIDARLEPLVVPGAAAAEEARGALENAKELLAEGSRTRYNLDVTLEELAAAARSLRIMADYLEQHPDALLRGRGR